MSFKQLLQDTVLGQPRVRGTLVYLGGGLALILYALKMTVDAYKPMPGMPIDGRGFLTIFFIPPVAAIGGILIAHGLGRELSISDRSIAHRIAFYPAFAVMAVIPSLGYILFFSGWDVSKELSTYRAWFVIALIFGLITWVMSELRQ